MATGPTLTPGTRRVFRVVTWLSFVTILVVATYGVVASYGTKLPVGQTLVDVYWPISPYFAQPVTYFSVACIAFFYAGLRIWQERIMRWPPALLSFLQLFGFVVAFSSAYEVLYNFMLWGSTYSIACANSIIAHTPCNPDVIISSYPVPWNLVFATRAFAALFVISGYSVYYLRRLSGSELI
ncbi:MAG: hypothetical protein OK438_01605 [Thaumarchaeota archaeon]|nr:hypothetical protein [Nitrososphaerota archaeon]